MSSTSLQLNAFPRHSFSDIAAQSWAQRHPGTTVSNVQDIGMVLNNIRNGGMGAVPIHNYASFIGVVGEHLEQLWQMKCRVIGEVRQKIEMCIGGYPGVNLEQARIVYSHPKALQQCSDILRQWPHMQKIEMETTTGGAQKLLEPGNTDCITLASRSAIEETGVLKVIRADVANLPATENQTKMWIVDGSSIDEQPDPSKENHAAIFIPRNRRRILHRLTGILGEACDLQKIDSFSVDRDHCGFFIPMRNEEGVGAMTSMLEELKAFEPLQFPFSELQLSEQKKAAFHPLRRRSVVWLGSWSDEDAYDN